MAKLIETFLGDLPERLASVESAIDREDFESFAAEAVALRGSSSASAQLDLSGCVPMRRISPAQAIAAPLAGAALDLIKYGRSLPDILRRAAATSE